MANLLVVEDDAAVRGLLVRVLGRAGHAVREAATVARLRDSLAVAVADLVVLDVTLPDGDGLSLARELSSLGDGPGILLLSALGDSADRIAGLEAGADDYLVKPCEPVELLARIEMILRRRRPATAGLHLGPWRIDRETHAITHANGRSLRLSAGELAMVTAFARHPDRVFARDELLDLAPSRSDDPFDRSIDHRIARLRRKLGGDGTEQTLIRSIRGRGYVHRR